MVIKVLVVDDSAFMRRVISDMISADSGMEVVATAKNGQEAVELAKKLKPAVITMDIEMPVLDGLNALKTIMEKTPTQVIMLSTLTLSGAAETLKALDYGAFDFVAKPNSYLKAAAPEVREQLLEKIRIASKVKPKRVARRHFGRMIKAPASIPARPSLKFSRAAKKTEKPQVLNKNPQFKNIVAVGCSTGGPRALQEVIPLLPGNIDAAVLIVQHMPPGFTRSLAQRLDQISQLKVKEAEDGDICYAGYVYVAPGDRHMIISEESGRYIIRLDDNPKYRGHRPSVDIMYKSLARLKNIKKTAVLLTGMGSDGAEGMQTLKNNAVINIAQDEKSCVVYGMPKSAVNLGVVDKVVGIKHISEEILKSLEV